MDFLSQQNKRITDEPLNNVMPILAGGKHVVVIGGGDTGSDCIGTSNRQGALSVTQIEIMPAPPEKENKQLTWPNWPMKMRTSSSQEEGVARDFAVATVRFEGENGQVKKLICARADDKFQPIGLVVGPCGQWEGTRDTSREAVVAIGDDRAVIQRQSEVMDPPEDWVDTAVSGWPALVMGCKPLTTLPGSDSFTRAPHPRTAVGISKDRRTMYFVVADGRRAGAPGLTLPQLASFMATRLHACAAVNLDGGGSSAMWVSTRIVNHPADGVERPVGDHLAVVWMGNDQNEQTGLYGATGAMRVWSGIFTRLPSAPLKVSGKGLDWQWVAGANTTDASCPGARQMPFVAGFAPQYAACVVEPVLEAGEEEGGGWRSWFGLDKKEEEQSAPPAEPAPSPQP
jgi:hypothetical protein